MSVPGGIFNLEFNSDGKILAAACEKKNILIFDPLRREVVHSIDSAHTDCVNCIRWVMLSCSPFVVTATFCSSIVIVLESKNKNSYFNFISFAGFSIQEHSLHVLTTLAWCSGMSEISSTG